MWWFEWCRCWPGSAVTCTGGLFLWPTSADTVLADVVVVIMLQLALCGGGGGGACNIVTCTVWGWWWGGLFPV